MSLPDDTRSDERIGDRDLTHWPTRTGQGLVRMVEACSRSVSSHAVFYLTVLLGLGLVAASTAVGAEVYDAVSEQNGIAALDRPALDTSVGLRTPLSVTVISAFTQLGGPIGMPIIAGLLLVIMVWRWRSRTPVILLVLAVAGSLTMTTVGKALVGRARPPLSEAVPPYEYAFSFPSGHALNSTVIAGIIAYLVIRRLTSRRARVLTVAAAIAWAVLMGLSRVYLGHHWLTDVIFAWLLGVAWVALLVTAHRLFLTLRRTRRQRETGDTEA